MRKQGVQFENLPINSHESGHLRSGPSDHGQLEISGSLLGELGSYFLRDTPEP